MLHHPQCNEEEGPYSQALEAKFSSLKLTTLQKHR